MATKSQHSKACRSIPGFLRTLHEEAGHTQRDMGKLLKKPQSWVYNCETANRRVDVAELIGILYATSPKAFLTARVSMRSFSLVEVPCRLM